MLLHRIRLVSSAAVIGSVVVLLPVLADASGVGGVRVATSTVSKIVGLLTGDQGFNSGSKIRTEVSLGKMANSNDHDELL